MAESEAKGGCKSASATISGEGVYGKLKFESGIHRVQRVPATETSGRVHTSAASVAILPQADEVWLQLCPLHCCCTAFATALYCIGLCCLCIAFAFPLHCIAQQTTALMVQRIAKQPTAGLQQPLRAHSSGASAITPSVDEICSPSPQCCGAITAACPCPACM